MVQTVKRFWNISQGLPVDMQHTSKVIVEASWIVLRSKDVPLNGGLLGHLGCNDGASTGCLLHSETL